MRCVASFEGMLQNKVQHRCSAKATAAHDDTAGEKVDSQERREGRSFAALQKIARYQLYVRTTNVHFTTKVCCRSPLLPVAPLATTRHYNVVSISISITAHIQSSKPKAIYAWK